MGWSPQIHTGLHVRRTTQDTAMVNDLYLYGAITVYGQAFQLVLIRKAPNVVVLQPRPVRKQTGLG